MYRCRGCAHESPERWRGPCPACRGYWSIKTSGHESSGNRSTLASAADYKPPPRISTGLAEFDRVMGGGIVPGSSTIATGAPGIGKSTLLLQTADAVATGSRRVLYASGEESKDDVFRLAGRLGLRSERVDVVGNEGDAYTITDAVDPKVHALLILDSLQTACLPDCDADEGSAEQCRAVTNYLTAWCKRTNVAAIIVSHVNKDGDLAGPRAVEHLVDNVIYFDAYVDEDGQSDKLRVLSSSSKMRHGESGVEALLEMTSAGLHAPSKLKSKKLELV